MSLKETLEKSFETYAGMTIMDRAICDARDCLKPGARMSMYAQYIEKITPDKPYKKSQKSVAAAMDHFYVHGDMSLQLNHQIRFCLLSIIYEIYQ